MDSDDEVEDLSSWIEDTTKGRRRGSEDEADLLSQLISSQVADMDSSQNMEAAHAILESHEQQALLERADKVPAVVRANMAFWAEREGLEPQRGIPMPPNARFAPSSESVRMKGKAARFRLGERHAAVRA